MPLSSKSLTPAQRARVRAALEQLAARYPNQTQLAGELGVKQQTVSRALHPEGALGVKLGLAVAKARGQTFEELLGGRPARRLYLDLPTWTTCAREAEQHGTAPAAISAVGRWPASLAPEPLEWRFIAELAGVWMRWASAEERETEETADAHREAGGAASPKSDEAPVRVTRKRGQARS